MVKVKQYRYIGVNGILTTEILLEGIKNTIVYKLSAEEGKILTNGKVLVNTISVLEEDLDLWKEIDKSSIGQ